jgi:hypothetical protein
MRRRGALPSPLPTQARSLLQHGERDVQQPMRSFGRYTKLSPLIGSNNFGQRNRRPSVIVERGSVAYAEKSD